MALLGGAVVLPAPAQNCVKPGQSHPETPWAQQMLGPGRVWPLASGSRQVVAVLDSGVDGKDQPQLRDRIIDGIDFIDPKTKGIVDCTGHGTQVAGIIAAQSRGGIAFRGFAPNVRLLSARVSDSEDGNGPSAGTTGLANAIDWAIQRHATVINISLTTLADDQALRDAVARAIAADIVVVAAAGNKGSLNDGNPIMYPAAYPGVIAVGAIDLTGRRLDQSEHRNYVDIMAPGADILSTQAGGGLVAGLTGTSYAAAFVSATAALVRSAYPSSSVQEVARRLYATATPAPGGEDSSEYGHGIVNPYSAVFDRTSNERPAALPALSPSPADPAGLARVSAWRDSGRIAGVLTLIAVLVALVALGVAKAVPLGKRRQWRARMAGQVRDDPEDEQVPPPVQLFDEEVDA
jgi:type VII secretion-associated serine protease mycosin